MPIAHRRAPRHPFWRAVGYIALACIVGGLLLLAGVTLFLGTVVFGGALVEGAS
jgi:hypothetical protein